jgi:glycosyltransferase involved in cell wall biosynthesis
MTTILLNWQASNTFGWGIVGLNLFSHWSLAGELQPIMGHPIRPEDVMLVDPLRMSRIEPFIHKSNRACAEIAAKQKAEGQKLRLGIPVIHGLGNMFSTVNEIEGSKNIGRIVFEDTRTVDLAREKARNFDFLVAACKWNASLLRHACDLEVVHIPEGVDTSQFCPGPRSGLMDSSRFHVFSGGKIEYRKGQDIVLRAFREFAKRHDDATLVTCWQSQWPKFSENFKGTLDHPLRLTAQGSLDIAKWVADNGIDPRRIIEIPGVPNPIMPTILREMDCAIFPNRSEAATNLVAMEAMACGVPVVIARNTGMTDLIEDGNCIALERQGKVDDRIVSPAGWGTDGWGETDVEELIEAMERLYASTETRKQIAAKGVTAMAERTWKNHAERLKKIVLDRL